MKIITPNSRATTEQQRKAIQWIKDEYLQTTGEEGPEQLSLLFSGHPGDKFAGHLLIKYPALTKGYSSTGLRCTWASDDVHEEIVALAEEYPGHDPKEPVARAARITRKKAAAAKLHSRRPVRSLLGKARKGPL